MPLWAMDLVLLHVGTAPPLSSEPGGGAYRQHARSYRAERAARRGRNTLRARHVKRRVAGHRARCRRLLVLVCHWRCGLVCGRADGDTRRVDGPGLDGPHIGIVDGGNCAGSRDRERIYGQPEVPRRAGGHKEEEDVKPHRSVAVCTTNEMDREKKKKTTKAILQKVAHAPALDQTPKNLVAFPSVDCHPSPTVGKIGTLPRAVGRAPDSPPTARASAAQPFSCIFCT